jgi:cytochrome c biogenesis protein CcmG/thiol:disulfide interchange protein DsbE
MRRWAQLLVIATPAVGLLALLAYGFTTNPREIPSPLLGRPAASFSLPLFNGGRFSLDEHRGKVVIVTFWASWCLPCREEAPMLEAAWRTYRDRNVVVVGINVQDAEPAARRFIEEFGLTFPIGPDASGRIAIDYGVYGIPELFVVGRDGQITDKHVGAVSDVVLARRLDEALRGMPTSGVGRGTSYQSIR